MELTFPFRNLTLNELAEFLDKKKYKEYQASIEDPDGWQSEYFAKDLEIFRDQLPNFENEILQIINTSSQETIDVYFKTLEVDLNEILPKIDDEYLQDQVREWNKEILTDFQLKIQIEEDQYFDKDERRRYKHLEEYEQEVFYPLADSLALGSFKKIEKINYNFYCVDRIPDLLSEKYISDYIDLIKGITKELFNKVKNYYIPWTKGEIKAKFKATLLPIIFFEGEIDIALFRKAAEILNKMDLMRKIEIQSRGSESNLSKIWSFFKDNNIETIPQTKILIYDCDVTSITDNSLTHIHRRRLRQIEHHPIKKGIENLFPSETILKAKSYKPAMIDYSQTSGTRRGKEYTEETYEINPDEKTNFCKWVVENGTSEDFTHFSILFKMIEEILDK